MSDIFPWSVALAWLLYVLAVWGVYSWGVRPLTAFMSAFWRPTLRVLALVILLSPTIASNNGQLGISPALFVFAQGVWGASALVMIKALLAWLLFGALALLLVSLLATDQSRPLQVKSSERQRVEPRL